MTIPKTTAIGQITGAKRERLARGQMTAFTRDDLQLIRSHLAREASVRDLAILNVGIDTLLRTSDLIRLRVKQVMNPRGGAHGELTIRQIKTDQNVTTALSPATRSSIEHLVLREHKKMEDYLFTAFTRPHGKHISSDMVRVLVKRWATLAGLDPARYSGHSLRRTKAKILYDETGNIRAIMNLLGHKSLDATAYYLGVTTQDSLKLSREIIV